MKFLIITIFIGLNLSSSFSQSTIIFEESFGGSGNEDRCYDLTKFFDRGYILTGKTNSNDGDVTNSHGMEDAWIVRIDLSGNIIFQETYGGFYNEGFITSLVDQNGNIYSLGYSGGANQNVSTGFGGKDVWLVKSDSLGSLIWEKSYGGSADEAGYDMVFTENGMIMIACVSKSINGMISDHHGTNNKDVWILEINPNDGSVIWNKSFGGTGEDGHEISTNNHSFRSVSIATHSDSLFAFTAVSRSNDGDVLNNVDPINGNYWIVTFDINGNILNENCYGGTLFDLPFKIEAVDNGGFIIGGNSNSNNGDVTGHHGSTAESDAWIVMCDEKAELLWQKSIGGTLYDDVYDILQIDKKYYATGRSYSSNFDCLNNYGNTDIFVYLLDSLGNRLWSKNFGSTGYDESYGIELSPAGNIVVAGYVSAANNDVSSINGPFDFWVFEYTDVSTASEIILQDNNFILYPNPVENILNVNTKFEYSKIEIYDCLGNIIYSSNVKKSIDLNMVNSGIYFIRIFDKSEQIIHSEKFIKI